MTALKIKNLEKVRGAVMNFAFVDTQVNKCSS